MNDPGARFASWNDVVATFSNHIEHYCAHGGGENALVGLRAEGAVTLQYAGRVVYELFQNALDRARTRAVVEFEDGVLFVGNDGDGIRVDPAFDYSRPIEGEGRSDFHALCALHTSNKSADRQFGNKGIGFRSVFGVADRVRLWSRCLGGGWWGMELRQRIVPAMWTGSALGDLDELIVQAGTQPRPSFHFPRLLRSSDDPVGNCAGINTVVILGVADSEHRRQIEDEVVRLRNTRFQFVGLRRPAVDLYINGEVIASESGWPLVSQSRHHAGFAELAELAQHAEHPLSRPSVAVAWPRETATAVASSEPAGRDAAHADEVVPNQPRPATEERSGLFYNHLPTRMATGLPVDVHGDFQLKADREGMSLAPNNSVATYNLALLQRAADAHVEALQREARSGVPRSDFWRLCNRPEDAPPAWTKALKHALFPDGSLEVWVALAKRYFETDAAELSCHEFWNASLRWLETLSGCGHWTRTWQAVARKLCDRLEQELVRTIPVMADDGARTVCLPSRQEQGFRAERRVFYWSPRGGGVIPKVPGVLLRMGRVVTSFDLGSFTSPAGVQPFAESELLPELRQVPNDPATLDTSESLSQSEQAALLRFAYSLTGQRRSSVQHFAWRAFADNEDGERIGRALATMFLPTSAGLWEPGRQLSLDRIDMTRLATFVSADAELEQFAALLGVAPAGSVPLLEGGRAGQVPPMANPPRPQAPGSVPKIPALEPLLCRGSAPTAVLRSLAGLPPDSQRSRVHNAVKTTAWIDASVFRAFDGVPALLPFVAPLDVVLHAQDPQRVFFAVPAQAADNAVMAALGALNRPDDEACIGRVAHVLQGLRTRIPDPSVLSASVRLSLAALFNRLMSRLGDDEPHIPTLVEQAGRLSWLVERPNARPDAWLAHREERQALRRFFPDLALVAAEHRKGLSDALGVGHVRLRRRVRPDVDFSTPTRRALMIRDRIAPHLPVLAAVADQSRQAMQTLSAERLRRAWCQQQPIVEVADAWLEIRVEGPDRDPIAWRKHEYDDVFHVPSSVDETPGIVVFDVDPGLKEDPAWRLPLRHFGDAIAALLVNNIALGPVFAQVLASIDEERVDDFVERKHLGELVREWSSRLRPLSDEERQQLEQHIAAVCVDPAAALSSGRITMSDLRPDVAATVTSELDARLREGLPEQLAAYLPAVVVESDNQLSWQQWVERQQSALTALIESIGGLPPTWKKELHNAARAAFKNLRFSPVDVASAYLSEHGHQIVELDKQLSAIKPMFAPVIAAPLPPSQAGWRAGRGRSATGRGGPQRKLTTEDLVEESLALSAVGDAAEVALLAWVVEQTAKLRAMAGFEDTLLSVFKPGTKTWREVRDAIRIDDLPGALHIASRWSGAGFDVLGLELGEDGLTPVRYECKGIASGGHRIRVHVSRNELAVARRVRREESGRWQLVGVQPNGLCVDLTGFLDDLLDEHESALAPLHARGLEPDGLRLVVERLGE